MRNLSGIIHCMLGDLKIFFFGGFRSSFIIVIMFGSSFLHGCVGGTFTSKAFMKRDRFGESPVVDMRDMISLNEKKFKKKK
ncbi:MAG: hypothetical protein R3B45_11035 [Bdellovibrionota bacterium]